jgi:hypothetical protein
MKLADTDNTTIKAGEQGALQVESSYLWGGFMPSFSMFPAEQDVFITWKAGGPVLQDIRTLLECAPEAGGSSVTELYQLAKGKAEFHIGRFESLRAMEIRRVCEDRGLTARLA